LEQTDSNVCDNREQTKLVNTMQVITCHISLNMFMQLRGLASWRLCDWTRSAETRTTLYGK